MRTYLLKYYINIVIMAMFVCVFGVIQFFSVKELVVEQNIYSITHNQEQTASILSNLLADYTTAMKILENNEEIDEFIRVKSFDETNTENVLDEYNRYISFSNTIETILSNLDITRYCIYTADGYAYGNDTRFPFSNSEMKATGWYKTMVEEKTG